MPELLTFTKQMSPLYNEYLKSKESGPLDELQAGPSNLNQRNIREDLNLRLVEHQKILEGKRKEFLEGIKVAFPKP